MTYVIQYSKQRLLTLKMTAYLRRNCEKMKKDLKREIFGFVLAVVKSGKLIKNYLVMRN